MAKGKAARRKKSRPAKGVRRRTKRSTKRSAKRSAKRPIKRSSAPRKAKAAKPARARKAAPARPSLVKATARKKTPRLDRVRRTLDDTVQTPPSSLNMDRHGSAARTGRAEMEESRQNHASMGQDITGGDIDVNVEDAYFTGDEAPGGDNTSPDVDVVDDIGKALGVQYDDNEELKSSDKIVERDKHRWEMDPASSEDYKDRK